MDFLQTKDNPCLGGTAHPHHQGVLEHKWALLEGAKQLPALLHCQQQRNPAEKKEFGHFAPARMLLLMLPAAAPSPDVGFMWEGGGSPREMG